jgi:hypothetical protein
MEDITINLGAPVTNVTQGSGTLPAATGAYLEYDLEMVEVAVNRGLLRKKRITMWVTNNVTSATAGGGGAWFDARSKSVPYPFNLKAQIAATPALSGSQWNTTTGVGNVWAYRAAPEMTPDYVHLTPTFGSGGGEWSTGLSVGTQMEIEGFVFVFPSPTVSAGTGKGWIQHIQTRAYFYAD